MAERKKKAKAKVKPKSGADEVLADKIRAGQLLSHHLRKIAQEASELVDDPDSGDRIASKAEALARLMWKMALGYKELDVKTGQEKFVAPDRGIISLLFDRIEGRAVASTDMGARRRSLPDRISDQSRNRLNSLTANDTPKSDS